MLVGEVARGKALAVVVEAATVKDTNGEIVDLEDEDETETATEVAAEVTEGEAAEASAEESTEA
jgi:trigger factor